MNRPNHKDHLTYNDLDANDIRELDREHAWEKFFIEFCGLDFEDHFFYDKKVLTREIIEENLDDLIEHICKFKDFVENPVLRPRPSEKGYWVVSMDDIHIGFQILGLLILETGARLPFEVYDSIIYSTTWEYDKTRQWSQCYVDQRKKNLEIFRNLIVLCKSENL